jgi:hypothetical protein
VPCVPCTQMAGALGWLPTAHSCICGAPTCRAPPSRRESAYVTLNYCRWGRLKIRAARTGAGPLQSPRLKPEFRSQNLRPLARHHALRSLAHGSHSTRCTFNARVGGCKVEGGQVSLGKAAGLPRHPKPHPLARTAAGGPKSDAQQPGTMSNAICGNCAGCQCRAEADG